MIRPKRVYPAATDYSEDFTGEGEGAHCIVPYAWEAEHWYRMHLRCVTGSVTGNTVVEMWVCDLETGEYTLLCSYDIGYPDSAFAGSTGMFLENFLTGEAGQVRTLEICNPMYLDEKTQSWCRLNEMLINVMDDHGDTYYDGSYRYGVDGNCIWMITSGVGGNWRDNGKGQHLETFFMD